MTLDAYCDYTSRLSKSKNKTIEVLSEDQLANTIREHLDKHKLGIDVEENEMPDGMLSLFHPTLKIIKGTKK